MCYPLSRYYQVIMIIDIFQYSNMYTLRKSIQWLADEAHVKEECGPYVIKEGKVVLPYRIWSGRARTLGNCPCMTPQGGQSQIGQGSFTYTHV